MAERRKPMSEINIVPYVDVMLVLLVIFMATAPLLNQGVDVDLPQGVQDPATGAVVHGKIPDAQQGVVHRRSHRSSRSFGSKMSRKDSPRNVKPSVVRISGMPPATISQGVLRINA